jgi:hypothetical protein
LPVRQKLVQEFVELFFCFTQAFEHWRLDDQKLLVGSLSGVCGVCAQCRSPELSLLNCCAATMSQVQVGQLSHFVALNHGNLYILYGDLLNHLTQRFSLKLL